MKIALVIILIVTFPRLVAAEAFDYQLRDLNGKLHRVSDYRGKWLVINFWATWCQPCIEEMPELESFYRENRETAHVWGVSFEDSDKAKMIEYLDRLDITYPILGYGQDPLTGYGTVSVLPTTFIIDREGKFAHRFEGPINAVDISDLISRSK